ncbi:hypothetical protein ACQPYK_27875 [Streptosporangium sp. CA-135522]|uniref:hypothetical protein n=1 Tax=Streptosporangium sp. CA-135522 TaxID=3240072 RepID=UPI003D8BB2DF
MTEQPLATTQGPGADKLITPSMFLELLITWTDANLSEIASLWSMPGEGWEDPFRTGLTKYILSQYVWADLGAPDTRKVYESDKKQADFVLNGTVATRSADKVVVEVKCQSLGRLADFMNDFGKDITKLDEVADAYADCPRLAFGVFFTRDFAKGAKGADDPAETAMVACNFTKRLNDYDHVYFSDTYQPIRRKAGKVTAEAVKKSGAIHRAEGGTNINVKGIPLEEWDVHELGIVYSLLPSKNEVARQAAIEQEKRERQAAQKRSLEVSNNDSDEDFQTSPSKRSRVTKNKKP